MKLATLCYLRQDGKVLMIHRTKKENDVHEGKWNGLGGKFEPGETPEACCIREMREECGLEVETPLLRGFLTFPEFSKGEDWYVFVFTADRFTGELQDSLEGELRWIPEDELMGLNLWEGDRDFLPRLRQPGFFSGRYVYKDGDLIEKSVAVHET